MASNDGKLYIYITDKKLGEDGEGDSEEEEDKKKNPSALSKYAQHQFMHLIKNTAERCIDYSISNIGNFTGNYLQQEKYETMVSFAKNSVSLGLTMIAGAKFGPVGVAIAVGVYSVNKGIGFLQNYTTYTGNYAKIQHQQDVLQERYGINADVNNSRGTWE